MSKRQFMFVVACYVQSSFFYTMYYYNATEHETWLSFLGGVVGGIVLALMYSRLSLYHEGAGLVEMNKRIFGKSLGKFISIIYLCTFMLSCSRLLRESGQFVSGNILVGFNWIYVLVILTVMCAWAAHYSIKYFSSVAAFISVSLFIITAFFFVMLIPQMKFEFALPFGCHKNTEYLHSFMMSLTMPFSELAVFLVLMPDIVKEKREKNFVKSGFIKGIVIGSIFILITILRDTFVLGPLMSTFSYPGYEVIRLIDYRLLSHIESLYGAALIFLMFFKSALIFYCITKILADIFECKKNIVFSAFLIGVLLLISKNMWKSNVELKSFVLNKALYILLIVNVGLPLISIIISALRSKKSNISPK